MLSKRAAVIAEVVAAVAAAIARERRAFTGGAAYWLRQWGSPSPCPYSQSWLLDFPRSWLTVPRLLDILGPRPGERLLELGPGTGVYTLPVARAVEPSGTVDAFDVQQEMLDALMRRAHQQSLANIEPKQGDATRLPYDDASFDGAYLVTVLHEIPDQGIVLRELWRVVKPGGRIVVGEMSPLPSSHFVRLPSLVRQASAAGLDFERRLGPKLIFHARFTRASESAGDPLPGRCSP